MTDEEEYAIEHLDEYRSSIYRYDSDTDSILDFVEVMNTKLAYEKYNVVISLSDSKEFDEEDDYDEIE